MATGFPSKILAAVDFTEVSSAALRFAAQIASACEADVAALHVHQFETPAYFTRAQADELRRQFVNATDDARHALETAVSDAGLQRATARVQEGDPATTIIHVAGEERSDLIVMGTHGRRGIERFMLGSVAERVLRSSPVPVLTVRERSDRAAIQNIVCPVNDSNASREAFVKAARIAHCTGARLTAVHIDEGPAVARIDDLCAWIASSEQPRCDVQHLRASGNAAEEILRMASAIGADLLVVGATHRPFFDSTVLGSTTVRVVRHAACPVLTVSAAIKQAAA